MMDRDLIRQSLSNHSENLLSLLTREQSENPDFKHVAADLPQTFNQSENEEETSVLEHFIAKKADLLFLPSWKTSTPANECQETGEAYAVMPVLEQFMELSYDERRELFYRDVERGDVVVGRVSSLRDFGIFVTLVCCACGLERDVEDLEIKALCPIREVPSTGNHDDPLSYYQVGDFIRAGVKDIDRYYEKLTLSLYSSTLAPHLHDVKLGVISKEDLPLHYIRGERLAAESRETYDKLLHSSPGLANPLNVGYLLGKLGMDEKHTPSLMRGLQRTRFKEEDFAPALRKKQSVSWALKCVKTGVDHFKRGRHVEAMNAYNKALEIDTNNVEALVARGALYATKGSLVKAMGDFELALETCPSHRNAKKYLCQTLLERGGQLEEEEKLVTAESLYKRAMTLDDTLREADEALKKLQERMRKTLELKEQEAARHQEKAPPTETSAEKLRKILKEEKRMKRKRRHSTSSSSSTTSDSTSSPAKSVKKSRKRKHKKKHKRRRASSDSKDEMFLAPANTSASFLQQRQTITKLLHDDDDDDDDEEEQWCEKVARGRSEDTPFKPRLDDLDRNGDGAEQRWEGPKPRRDSSSSVQSEASHTSHKQRFSGPGESRPGRSERPDGGEERAGRGSDTSVVKDLRKANLIDIFSQIAEFQKAKKQKT